LRRHIVLSLSIGTMDAREIPLKSGDATCNLGSDQSETAGYVMVPRHPLGLVPPIKAYAHLSPTPPWLVPSLPQLSFAALSVGIAAISILLDP
jgi:hypothetical protein